MESEGGVKEMIDGVEKGRKMITRQACCYAV